MRVLLALVLAAGEGTLPLDGAWRFLPDPGDRGRVERWERGPPAGAAPHRIRVPAVWEEFPFGAGYDGVAWYWRELTLPADWAGRAVRLHFEGVSHLSQAWLDGRAIGAHESGHLPFDLDPGDAARPGERQLLAVRVTDCGERPADGLTLRELPHAKEDWYFNHGGIWGSVHAEALEPLRLDDVFAIPSLAGRRIEVRARVRLAAPLAGPQEVAIAAQAHDARATATWKGTAPGTVGGTLTLRFAGPPPAWSPASPRLLRLQVQAAVPGHSDLRFVPVGMRDFEVRDGAFHLNGKPILLKGLLYQPYYPGSLARPPGDARAWVRREVAVAKEAGFNLLRTHVRLAPRELLEAADELGMLVHAEPSIGWVYGDAARLEARAREEVEGLVLRDRNHPGIVLWGVLNELSGDLWRVKGRLAAAARALDPSRPVIDDSGGFGECRMFLPGEREGRLFHDLHPYVRAPLSRAGRARLADCGGADRLTYVSEFGFGGLTDLGKAVLGFAGEGHREDARRYREYLDRAERAFADAELASVFGDLPGLVAAAQELQAEGAADMVEALRANPHVAGYVFTQFQDAGFECSAGMVDVWGAPKRVHEAFRRVNAPALLILDAPRVLDTEEPGALTVTLSDETARGGPARLTVEARRGGESVRVLDAAVTLAGAARTSVLARDLALPRLAPGGWRLSARIEGLAEGGRNLLVLAPGRPPARPLEEGELVVVRRREWPMDDDADFTRVLELFEHAHRGGTVALLDPPPAPNPLIGSGLVPAYTRRGATGHFLGKFHFVRRHPLLEGLPAGGLLRGPFAEALPVETLAGFPGRLAIAGTIDAIGAFEGADLAEVPLGRGRVILSTFRESEDPVGRRLRANLARSASSFPPPGPAAPGWREPFLRSLREARGRLVRVAVAGPFPSDADLSGFDRAFPPESADDFGESWRRLAIPDDGHVDFERAVGAHDRSVAYAGTFVHAPGERRLRLAVGSDDAVRAWVGGEEVLARRVHRGAEPRQDVVAVTLRPGWNRLLFKVVDDDGGWELYFELLDEEGQRAAGLYWSPDRKLPD